MKGGKTGGIGVNTVEALEASMRPAREGRENPDGGKHGVHDAVASMRPAREGRENAYVDFEGALNNVLQ